VTAILPAVSGLNPVRPGGLQVAVHSMGFLIWNTLPLQAHVFAYAPLEPGVGVDAISIAEARRPVSLRFIHGEYVTLRNVLCPPEPAPPPHRQPFCALMLGLPEIGWRYDR
jgi:hypothetical protein